MIDGVILIAMLQKLCKHIPTMETINNCIKQALYSSSLAIREQYIRDIRIMIYNCSESKFRQNKERYMTSILSMSLLI